MGTLILKLAGPLQSWGAESRFTERKTRHEPTKSGVVGLLASALGRRRTESVEDLVALPMGVRVDQEGTYERDFHTAHTRKFDQKANAWVFKTSLPLSSRYYLADAVFVVGVEAPDDTVAQLADALEHPSFPLFLGRRSCPPATKVLLKACEGIGLVEALQTIPWQASERYARRAHAHAAFEAQAEEANVVVPFVRDVLPDDKAGGLRDVVCDIPISFSEEHRRYEWRTILIGTMCVPNPHAVARATSQEHDPFSALGEADN